MKASPVKLTPMLEHYLRVKDEYPDALLFYRMGDFYELFFEDAHVAAKELQITLTSRNPNSEAPVPMCGVPHHAVQSYLAQLLDKGFKVAICEQVEDPKEAKGLVKREVTRVLTPGTAIDDANLPAKNHNFLAALYWDTEAKAGGLAWVDYSTGEWTGLSSRDEPRLWQWAEKIGPRELLLPDGRDLPRPLHHLGIKTSFLPIKPDFDLAASRDRILTAQGVADLSTLDVEDKPQLVRAMGALLAYLKKTQKQDFAHLGAFSPLNLSRHLLVDEVTERNLEIFRRLDGRKGKGTLWNVLDMTMTAMGGRHLESRLRQPWTDMNAIQRSHDAVEFFTGQADLRASLRNALDGVYDLERLSTRIFLNRAAPKDFVGLRQSLLRLPDIQTLFQHPIDATSYSTDDASNLPDAISELLNDFDDLADIAELLSRSLVDSPPVTITDGGLFQKGFNPELDELIELTEHGEGLLKNLLADEKQAHSLPRLKLGYNRVFGHYFELPKSETSPPEHFIRRQTLANSERYITEQLKELEDKLMSASEKRKNVEYKLFSQLRETVAAARPRFMSMARVVAELDVLQGLAEAAIKWQWTRPVMHDGLSLSIREGRHPVVEAVQGMADFIPNDLDIREETKLLLVTGPNMAGKSTVLRQTAIICIMAQIGSFVPAKHADIGLTDRIFSRVGASDNLAQGQSTFMVEMMETARILRQAGKRSLVILDEIGRGTSTFDGLALAWSVVEELVNRKAGSVTGIRTLFATHYHELTQLEGRMPGLRNINIAVKEWKGDIIFLRRLVPGPSDRSYGIEVAKLAGVPAKVVTRAKEILGMLEEKSKDRKKLPPSPATGPRGLLPGLAAPVEPSQPVSTGNRFANELHAALLELHLDRLTPLEALNLLGEWKEKWGAVPYEKEN